MRFELQDSTVVVKKNNTIVYSKEADEPMKQALALSYRDPSVAAYSVLARGGTAVVAGQVADGVTITIDPFVMSDQERSLIGSNYGSSRAEVDFALLVDHYMHGRIDLDSLVTDVIPLAQINDGFDGMVRGEGIRSVIRY